jgi:hypothetical protein
MNTIPEARIDEINTQRLSAGEEAGAVPGSEAVSVELIKRVESGGGARRVTLLGSVRVARIRGGFPLRIMAWLICF